MKTLCIEDMKQLECGAPSQRQRAITGVTIAGTFIGGVLNKTFWGVTATIITMNANCF